MGSEPPSERGEPAAALRRLRKALVRRGKWRGVQGQKICRLGCPKLLRGNRPERGIGEGAGCLAPPGAAAADAPDGRTALFVAPLRPGLNAFAVLRTTHAVGPLLVGSRRFAPFPWDLRASIESGHFYFAQTGHSHFAATSTLPTLVGLRLLRYHVSPSESRLRNRPLTRSRRGEPWRIGSSIVYLSCSVLRSCAYVYAIAFGLALLLVVGYSSVRGALLLTAIAVNIWYGFAIVLSVACLLCM